MRFSWVITCCVGLLVVMAMPVNGEEASQWPMRIDCEGRYPGHLQGVCVDEEYVYWSFTTWLVKTDRQGKLLKKVEVADHHGDCCYVDGRVYVAVNLGKFNDPAGNADSWVYVYDAESLEEIAQHEVQQVKYGAGGIASYGGRFMVVGGLPDAIDENYVYEYDHEFEFVEKHVLASGHTHLGIQGATILDGEWWFACYGAQVLQTTENCEMIGRYDFECGYGILGLGDGCLYIARGKCKKGEGCDGYLLRAVPDSKVGLKVVGE